MREIIAAIESWGDAPVAVATVVSTWGSAPRQVGAKMALTPDGRIAGSVSGGCIEAAVFEAGVDCLSRGASALLSFGVSDETAFEKVGLACGGSVEVFVAPLAPELRAFWSRVARDEVSGAAATLLRGENAGMTLLLSDDGATRVFGIGPGMPSNPEVADALAAAAREALDRGQTGRTAASAGEAPALDVFAEALLPAPTLIIIGGVHIAVALVPIAHSLGYRALVLDPRKAFANAERFPSADGIISEWPDRALAGLNITANTAIVALTHDEKLDDPAIKAALRSRAFYVGALGGKVTREKRRKRLAAAGFSDMELARLHQPIGLDIGAAAPEEIALATMAQIVAARHGRA